MQLRRNCAIGAINSREKILVPPLTEFQYWVSFRGLRSKSGFFKIQSLTQTLKKYLHSNINLFSSKADHKNEKDSDDQCKIHLCCSPYAPRIFSPQNRYILNNVPQFTLVMKHCLHYDLLYHCVHSSKESYYNSYMNR